MNFKILILPIIWLLLNTITKTCCSIGEFDAIDRIESPFLVDDVEIEEGTNSNDSDFITLLSFSISIGVAFIFLLRFKTNKKKADTHTIFPKQLPDRIGQAMKSTKQKAVKKLKEEMSLDKIISKMNEEKEKQLLRLNLSSLEGFDELLYKEQQRKEERILLEEKKIKNSHNQKTKPNNTLILNGFNVNKTFLSPLLR